MLNLPPRSLNPPRRAGGWKALFASRHATLREADPWLKPSPYEVQASGELDGVCLFSSVL